MKKTAGTHARDANGVPLVVGDHIRSRTIDKTGIVTNVSLSPDPRYGVEFREDDGTIHSGQFESMEHI